MYYCLIPLVPRLNKPMLTNATLNKTLLKLS